MEVKEHYKKLTFECSSSSLKPLSMKFFSDSDPIIFVEEIPHGGIIRYTKFRTMLKLEIKITGYIGDLYLFRQAGTKQKYILKRGFGEDLFYFEPESFLRSKWSVRNNAGIVIAYFKHKNPFVIGADNINIYLNDDTLYAKISLKFTFLSFAYKKGEIFFFEERESYEPLAIAICIINIVNKQMR